MTRLHSKVDNESRKDDKNASTNVISDLDARVLQSILDEQKVDIATEESMKDLLKSRRVTQEVKDNKESTYTSTFFQKLEDQLQDPFWSSVRIKASEAFESAKIFVSNRIERDAKLLASLGLFTLNRAINDVSRALPSQSSSGIKKILQLSSNSSFTLFENKQNNFLLPSIGNSSSDSNPLSSYDELYKQLSTPMDEIKIVSESIRDILKSTSSSATSSEGSTPFFANTVNSYDQPSRRALKSFAKAGSGKLNNDMRQQQAYERRKQTVIQQEKEPINAKLGRAASSVTSAAWEIQREMKVEVNSPGYRSETVRKQIGSSVNNAMLKAGEALSLDATSSWRRNDDDVRLLNESYETVFVSDVIGADDAVESVECTEELSYSMDIDEATTNVPSNLISDVDFELSSDEINLERGVKSAELDNEDFGKDLLEVEVLAENESIDDFLNAKVPEEGEMKENLAVNLTLRLLDIVFFVAEKSLTVGIPGIFKAWHTVRTRSDSVKRNGLGKEGWDALENLNIATKRY